MFYTCIATEDKKPRILYSEHFVDKEEMEKRAKQLQGECYNHDGAMWKLYKGEECFESAYAKSIAPIIKHESDDTRQNRLNMIGLEASKTSVSVLTDPEIDDVPQWYKQGFNSQEEMDFRAGKIGLKEYEAYLTKEK